VVFQSWLFCPSINNAFRFVAAASERAPRPISSKSLRRVFISKCYITNGMLGQDHYIYRLRAACILQPELNRYQLAALDRELALVRAAATPEEHLSASGYMIGLARGAALDRAANALDIARRYDDPWAAAAAGIEFVHAQQGSDHVELLTSIQAGHERAGALRTQSIEIHAAFLRLFLNLLHVHTSNYQLDAAYLEIEASFQILRNSDPAFVPHTWLDLPRYRRRLPWQADLLHEWLAPYWDDAASPPYLPADPGAFPPPLRPGGEWPDAEPLDARPDTSLADAFLERQQVWPDEALAAHWQETRDAMLAARSPIAQYAVASDREALFSIESTRHMLWLNGMLAPLRAIANQGWEESEDSRAGVEKAEATIHALTGYTPAEIFNLPRIWHFVVNNLEPRLNEGTEGFGAMAGEGGFDLVRHARIWLEAKGAIDFDL
jgi:hypothetical protein